MELFGYYLFIILLRSAWGTICYEMAKTRNRNPKIAFALGFMFGLFSVIGYAIAGNKNN